MVEAVLLDHLLHGVSAPFWAISAMDLCDFEALLPRRLPYALPAGIPVAQVPAGPRTSSLIRVERIPAAVTA